MRCRICDVKLQSGELLRKDTQGDHLDTCNRCLQAIYENTEEYDYVNDINFPLDILDEEA